MPRFRLRTLLVVGVAFCLLFGWIGRNAVRMRQEEAAFEALKRTGGGFYLHGSDESYLHEPADFVGYPDALGRLLGWKKAPKVRRVRLGSFGSPDPDFERALKSLATFEEIENVDLIGRGVTDESLQALTRLPRLESVLLGNTSVTSAGVERLSSPLSIREFYLLETDSGSQAFVAGLRELKELRVVSLSGSSLSREDVEALASLPNLEELRLTLVLPASGDVYAPLANATKLRSLRLFDVGCDDADMMTIAQLPTLEELFVEGITDAGVVALGEATGLRVVELRAPVTREVALKHSAGHPQRVVRYWDGGNQGPRYFRGGKPILPGDLSNNERRAFDLPQHRASAAAG